MSISLLSEIESLTKEKNIEYWQVVMEDDMNERKLSADDCFEQMRAMYRAMKEADRKYCGSTKSASNLVGGDGQKLEEFRKNGDPFVGEFLMKCMEKAVKMGESNACMKRVVAAPTAGSCGIIPAVFITYEEQRHADEDRMVKALFVTAGIGSAIATNACLAGAEGGCQAEIGSASSMAAGGLAYLEGGDAHMINHAAALSLKNMLGLTCDPVAGLVEVPCIKRNVAGAANAIAYAQMALAGIESVIPPDQVIDAMWRIGRLIPSCLRETSENGLATTERGLEIWRELHEE